MGADSDTGKISRRDFLKIAGAGAAKIVIPDLGIPDPPEPKLKPTEELTEGDKINMALPLVDRMSFLLRRGNAGFGIKMDLPNFPELVNGNPLPEERHKVLFPNFSFNDVRDHLKELARFVMPDQLSFFSHPQLNFSYQIPFNSYRVRQNQVGHFDLAGEFKDVYIPNQRFLPDNIAAVVGGVGYLGQLWELKATEYHRFGKLEVNWLAARSVPSINQKFFLGSPTDKMAGAFEGDAEMHLTDAAGNFFTAVTFEQVFFVPISVKPIDGLPPEARPEFQA